MCIGCIKSVTEVICIICIADILCTCESSSALCTIIAHQRRFGLRVGRVRQVRDNRMFPQDIQVVHGNEIKLYVVKLVNYLRANQF
jgi:hypothetical protein